MKALCALLVFTLAAPALARPDTSGPDPYMKKAMRAEVLVVGEIVEIHDAPGSRSGATAALQYVRYKKVDVILGNLPAEQFEVAHAHRLSPALFKPGNQLLLILDPDETRGPQSPWAKGIPTLFCFDEQAGAVAATPELLEDIDYELLGNMFVGGPAYAARVKATPIVAIAEVLEVGLPPGLWMGTIIPSVQSVIYKVIEVLKGDLKAEKIEVGYYMIRGTRLTDTPDGRPGLTPALFTAGNRLVLLLTPGKCVENLTGPGPESGLPVYCSGDVQFGAVPTDEEYLAKVRNALRKP
jgi:hypothetical protein